VSFEVGSFASELCSSIVACFVSLSLVAGQEIVLIDLIIFLAKALKREVILWAKLSDVTNTWSPWDLS